MAYNGFVIDKYLDDVVVTKQLDELTKIIIIDHLFQPLSNIHNH